VFTRARQHDSTGSAARRGRTGIPSAIVLFALTASAACDSVLDSTIDPPDHAEVTVDGSSPVPLRLILSSRFIGIRNPDTGRWDITLHDADTVEVTELPITRGHDLNETGVFFAFLGNPDPDETATVHMRVRIDGQEVYSQQATMRDASIEYVFFTQ
jgi:hypothetical protein